MEWPTLNHVFYIPLIFALGALVGSWFGRRQLTMRIAAEEKARRQLEERRKARQARREARGSATEDSASEPHTDADKH